MILPPLLFLKDTVRDAVGLAIMQQLQYPQPKMPSQVYANYVMGPPQVTLSFRAEPPINFIMLVSAMVSTLYFQVHIWLLCSLVGAQSLVFTPPQPFGVYTWPAYVLPGAGQWFMPGICQVAAPPTALSMGSFMLLTQLPSSHSINMTGHTG